VTVGPGPACSVAVGGASSLVHSVSCAGKGDLTGHPHARTEPGNVNKNLPLFLCLLIKN
jgi:hypothetical protein